MKNLLIQWEVKVSVTESSETWVRVEDPFCDAALGYMGTTCTCSVSSHLEQRPQNIYSEEEICIIILATEISLFSLQISKT